MNTHKLKNILVAPLDWGLGHTTRCVPMIQFLLSSGHNVLFAGNDWQRQYILRNFPSIETIHLEGYDVRYAKSRIGFSLSLLRQTPCLLKTIKKEHEWLINLVAERKIDGIISDNRYGLYHPSVPSVIITHQLQIQSGLGKTTNDLLRKLHYKYLGRFNECWVADVEGSPNLSSKLAHPKTLPANAKYIGWLSQIAGQNIATKEEHLLVLLSGPEPQRSILSKILWQQVIKLDQKIVFVEGSDMTAKPDFIPSHISYHKRLNRDELLPLIANASFVICRSGYSSLMDLLAMKKKAIIIPTPGQTEQEYLAKHLHQEGVLYSKEQKGFDLKKALTEAKGFPFKKISIGVEFRLHQSVLNNWMDKI